MNTEIGFTTRVPVEADFKNRLQYDNFVWYRAVINTLTGVLYTRKDDGTIISIFGIPGAGTSGGILGFTAATTLASSVLLTLGAPVVGGGAGATPYPLPISAVATRYLANTGPLNAAAWDTVSLTTGASGVLQAAQFPALLGDVTTSAGSLTTAIGSNKVTLGMMAQIADARILGNSSGITANVSALATLPTQVQNNITRVGTLAAGAVPTTLITGILPGANGGTNNGFMDFAGPATSLKTFTVPNASCSLLTTNAAVTVPQGGTGLATLPANQIPFGNGASPFQSSSNLIWDGTAITVTNAGAGQIILNYTNSSSTGWFQFNEAGAGRGYVGVEGTTRVGGGGLLIGDGAGTMAIRAQGALALGTNGYVSPRVFIDISGNSGFGGNTTPTAKIHPAAGTAGAATGPFKFTLPGVPVSIVEAGLMETDANYLYWTNNTPSRKWIAMSNAALTTGKIPVATTTGYLQDGPAWDGTTLTSAITGALNGTLGATTRNTLLATTGNFNSTLGVTGTITGGSTIATADPGSGAGTWRLGVGIAGIALALDTTEYVEISIGGAVKKLAKVL